MSTSKSVTIRWMVLMFPLAGGCVDVGPPGEDAGVDVVVDLECDDATQLVPTDFAENGVQMFPGADAAGIERCDFSTFNSTSIEACSTDTTAEDCNVPIAEGGGCGTDAPCERGRCLGDASGECRCRDFCASDEECGGGEACVCSSGLREDDTSFNAMTPVPTCVPAECRTGEDCLSGKCGVVIDSCGNPLELRCRSVADECVSNASCVANDEGGSCLADNGSGWVCGFGGTCE